MFNNLVNQSQSVRALLTNGKQYKQQVRCEAALNWWIAQQNKNLPESCFEYDDQPF